MESKESKDKKFSKQKGNEKSKGEKGKESQDENIDHYIEGISEKKESKQESVDNTKPLTLSFSTTGSFNFAIDGTNLIGTRINSFT